ncbi:uncharacterized protein SCHCODRAFT_02686884 [Schizophyllum commune H4-8]|uniref:uncharacterized protein n=1 Tax=Schizophyllum commune (strain H4-8 / FGSC 9210) TaxID=578458 RepID=UPI00215FB840|nr:uncharacterized protein SCHCODRAFT_02686884 [Schizophyllum commune H4-8]KAI5895508.1 hypothetical protein SCHCODRAFT_02686884 [Schizophyllum commune H4-8]
MASGKKARARRAQAPFDDAEADVILRSSDGVDFRAHKLLLSLVSTFFRDMFSLPHVGQRGPDDGDRAAGGAQTPIVEVEENADLLEKFLRWCDPRCTPSPIATWEDVNSLVTISIKYDAVSVSRRASEIVQGSALVAQSPLRSYALAVRSGNRTLAERAAKKASRAGLDTWEVYDDMKHMPVLAYHRLLVYHLARGQRAAQIIEEWGGRPHGGWGQQAGQPDWDHVYGSGCTGQWWTLYIRRLCAEAKDRPDGTRSSALRRLSHDAPDSVDKRGLLCRLCESYANVHALRFLGDLAPALDFELGKHRRLTYNSIEVTSSRRETYYYIQGGTNSDGGGSGGQETPTMDVEEDADTLERFLRWCDPRCTPPFVQDWEDIQAMMAMSIKYDAPSVGRHVSECMQGSAMVSHSPVRAYVLAMRTGNRRLAQMAAREASRAGIETWKSCKEMEHMSGLLYHRLLDYHIARVNEAVRIVEDLAALPTTDWEIGVPRWSHVEGSGCTGQWWKLYVERLCAEVRQRPDGFGSSRLRELAQHTPTEVDRAGVLCELCVSNAHPHAMRFWSEGAVELDLALGVDEIVLQLAQDQVRDGGRASICTSEAADSVRIPFLPPTTIIAIHEAMSSSEKIHARRAKAPFSDAAADVVLRTSDRVDFRVHKLLLCLVSTFFSDMFSLPHIGQGGPLASPGGSDGGDRASGRFSIPVVEVEEDAETLEQLLRWCDPRCTPLPLTTWKDVQTIAALAVKYDAPSISRRVSEFLRGTTLVKESPLQAYAFAVRVNSIELAQLAAREASRAEISAWKAGIELNFISGSAYHRLLEHHFACARRGVQIVEEWTARDTDTNSPIIGIPPWKSVWSDHHGLKRGTCSCGLNWWKVLTQTLRVAVEKQPRGLGSTGVEFPPKGLDGTAPSLCEICMKQGPMYTVKFIGALATHLDSELDKQDEGRRNDIGHSRWVWAKDCCTSQKEVTVQDKIRIKILTAKSRTCPIGSRSPHLRMTWVVPERLRFPGESQAYLAAGGK